jgi:addiction module HigA family antidote
MVPVHPGRILKRELATRELTASAFAAALRLPESRVRGIIGGRRRIDVETALRLARYFGNSPQFWMNLQTNYDLALAERALGRRVRSEVRRAA